MEKKDPYFKKQISFRYENHDLHFRVSQALFSSQDIDVGTRHLLKTITNNGFENYGKVLDLGCGYGPIGISLKATDSKSIVHMVDKDALALKYTAENAQLNGTSDVKVYASLGYDAVSDTDFDLIISNIPAKVGDHVLSHLLLDAQYFLKPTGKVLIVVIDAIGEYVTKVLKDESVKILFQKRWPGHLVFHYEFLSHTKSERPVRTFFEEGIYDRSETAITMNKKTVPLKTTYNLPEFDTLSYETELILHSLRNFKDKSFNHVIIFNPGQGYIPISFVTLSTVKHITLIDRDLQSLKTSQQNLLLNGYHARNISLLHQVGLTTEPALSSDAIIGILSEKDSFEVHMMFLHEAIAQLSHGGLLMLCSNSTAITRLTTLIKGEKLLTMISKEKRKGKSVLVVQKKSKS